VVEFWIDPSPQPSPQRGEGEREPISVFFKLEFGSVIQVDVNSTFSSVGSLSPLGRGLG